MAKLVIPGRESRECRAVAEKAKISPKEITKEVLHALRECGCDPIVQLAHYALGDVVALGLMTQDEYDSPPEYDLDGNIIVASGKVKALDLIPPKLRMDAIKELAQYEYAKVKATERSTSTQEVNGVVFYLPDNGRDPELPKSYVNIDGEEIRDAH